MALVSTRKKHMMSALLRARLGMNPQFGYWLMLLTAVIGYIAFYWFFVTSVLSVGLEEGWDAFIANYARIEFHADKSGYDFFYKFAGTMLFATFAWSVYIVLTFIHYKLYKYPRFRRRPRSYNRELPSSELHPVVISRFLNQRSLPDDIFIALLHLAALDAVTISGSLDKSSPDYFLPSAKTGFFIHLQIPSSAQSEIKDILPSDIDRAAYKVMQSLANKKGVLKLEKLKKTIAKDYARPNSSLGLFSSAASNGLSKAELIDKGKTEKKTASRASLAKKWFDSNLLIGLIGYIFFSAYSMFNDDKGLLTVSVCFGPPLILMILLKALFEFNITEKGYRILDECRACKRWIDDFTALRQAHAGATEIWDDYLTYAYVLEANEPLIKDLQKVGSAAARSLCEAFVARYGYPRWWWDKTDRAEYEVRWNDFISE